jgi:hypothetical protein
MGTSGSPESTLLKHATPRPCAHPQYIGILDMDASAELDGPARTALQYLRGGEGHVNRNDLVAMSAADADHASRG